MRVTLNMIYGNTTRNLNQIQQRYLQLEEILLSNKKINRPSDDPVGAARALDLDKTLSVLGQFERNLSQADGYVTQIDVALNNVIDRMQRAIELTTDINGGVASAGDYAAAAEEMDGILDEVLRNANMKYGNRYVFAGYDSTNPPFDDVGNYTGGASGEDIDLEIAQGQYLTINMTGDDVFKNGIDVMQTLIDTRDAIAAGDQTLITNQLPLLQDALDQIIVFNSENGAKQNRISVAENDHEVMRESITAMLSDVEDADIVAMSSEFAQQEQVLQASQLVASRILSQNFLDFLA